MQGGCVFISELLPVIILSNEAPNGSTFTLCHEFAHIILRQSAVSDGIAQKHNQTNAVESWCNRFAGAFLVPNTALMQFFNPVSRLSQISDENLTRLANKFAVSRHAMLVRLVQL